MIHLNGKQSINKDSGFIIQPTGRGEETLVPISMGEGPFIEVKIHQSIEWGKG